jgi:hypothetical protein
MSPASIIQVFVIPGRTSCHISAGKDGFSGAQLRTIARCFASPRNDRRGSDPHADRIIDRAKITHREPAAIERLPERFSPKVLRPIRHTSAILWPHGPMLLSAWRLRRILNEFRRLT